MINGRTNIPEATFDLIIIGAGINGAGIARDAAMRGLRVLLLDKGDVGGGTSSWSTRLIHGGLRYLEHGEFGLVRESLRERETLMKIAPHLVRPLPILIPIYKGARRGRWTMRAGMLAYDALSFDKTLPRHQMLSRDEALAMAPTLNPDGLAGAAVYYDAQVEFAERLVVENVLAAIEYGAMVITYARVDRLIIHDGKVTAIEFSDEINGLQSVRGHVVINAAGPWVDEILRETPAASPRLIGGTKGSHLIVGRFPGAPDVALYVEARSDRRPFFIIPWNSQYLIGTTDLRFAGDLDDVRITEDEVDYLLGETNRVLPGANLCRDQILYSYSGVRPLPFTEDKDEQSITRQHFIRQAAQVDNLLSIVGGKLTTYRGLSEKAVDNVLRFLGCKEVPSETATTNLPGASTEDFTSFAGRFKMESPVDGKISERLLRIYGTRAGAILKLADRDPSLAEPFDEETGALAAEIVFAFEDETAQTLTDCLLRRTMVGLNSSCGLNAVEAAASVARRHLAWSDAREGAEIVAYRRYLERFRLFSS